MTETSFWYALIGWLAMLIGMYIAIESKNQKRLFHITIVVGVVLLSTIGYIYRLEPTVVKSRGRRSSYSWLR